MPSKQNAVECLRELLDERGVVWTRATQYDVGWHTPDGRRCSALYLNPNLTVCIDECTPEQAVAATLDHGTRDVAQERGTCHITWSTDDDYWEGMLDNPEDTIALHCHACGRDFPFERHTMPKFCPYCGKRVV